MVVQALMLEHGMSQRPACFGLPEEASDLLLGESALPHVRHSHG